MLTDNKNKTKKEIDRLFFLSDGRLVDSRTWKRAALQGGTKAGESQELREDRSSFTRAGEGFAPPPFNFRELAALLENNTTHYRSVVAKVNDSAGSGWDIVKSEDSALDSEGDRLRDFFKRVNERGQNVTDVLKCAITDFESIGNLGIEVIADMAGIPIGLNHVQSTTLFASKDFRRIAHIVDEEKQFFKVFGVEADFNRDTGEEGDFPFPQRANEILWRIKYHPKSDFYGVPDIIPALGGISLDISSRNFNLDFFDNWAVPAWAVIIEGGELTPDSRKFIEDFFAHEMQGEGNQHRTIVIPVPQEGVKVKIQKISTDQKDGHFKELREFVRDEILSANGVPGIRAFISQAGAFGRDQSREINRIYKDSTIRPLNLMIDNMINDVIREGFGIRGWEFKIKGISFDERELTARTLEAAAKTNTLTTNEKRELLSPLFPDGLEDVEGGDVILVNSGGIPTPIAALGSPLSDPGVSEDPPQDPENDEDDPKKFSTKLDYTQGGDLLDHDHDLGKSGRINLDREIPNGEKIDAIRRKFKEIEALIGKAQESLAEVFDDQRDRIVANFAAQIKSKKTLAGRWKKLLGKAEPFDINVVLKDLQKTVKAISIVVNEARDKSIRQGFKTAAAELGISLDFGIVNPRVTQFLTEETAALSANINATLSNRVRNRLIKGMRDGETLEEIAQGLQRSFDGNRKRALMIARTETARAYNVGSTLGYRESGLVNKVKVFDVGALDDPGCLVANGKVWTLDVAQANPIEHPNCVRTFRPIVGRGRRRS